MEKRTFLKVDYVTAKTSNNIAEGKQRGGQAGGGSNAIGGGAKLTRFKVQMSSQSTCGEALRAAYLS